MHTERANRGLSALNLSSMEAGIDLAATTTAAVALTSATGIFFFSRTHPRW